MTEQEVTQALSTVMDPELNVSIVDMGLVYNVTVTQLAEAGVHKWKIHILLTLTSPGCPLAGSFQFLIWDALRIFPELDPESDVSIELTFDPPWTQDMMTAELKAQFGVGEW